MRTSKLHLFKYHPGIFLVWVLFAIICHCDAQTNYKIGLLAPLTGANKAIGQSVSAAVNAALPEANKYLIQYNMQISLVEKDTEGNPETALSALTELDIEGIQLVIGPCLSSATQRCLSFANSKSIILISPSSTSTLLRKEDCLFRMLPPDNNQGAALAKYVASVNIKEVLPVYINDSYGKSLKAAFVKAFKEQSGSISKCVAFKTGELADINLIKKIVKATSSFSNTENACILFIGYGKLNTFFEYAANNEALTQYRWFSSEALLASSPDFLAHEILSDFAHKTKLTTISIHPENIITDLYNLYIHKQSKAQLPPGETLIHYACPAWNALWLATEAIRRTANGDATNLKQAVTALGSGDAFYGMERLQWDKNGDSSNGSFYMLEATPAGTNWQTKAICKINSNWAEPNLKLISALIWPPAKSAPEITLHGLFPLSGDVKLTSAKDGFELAIQHINEYFKSEDINTTFNYVSHDTQTNPDVALSIASELYQKESVPLFIGPCVSSIVENVATGLPEVCLVSPTSTALALAKTDDYVARLCPTDAAQAKALATLLTMNGVDKTVIIYRDDIWGQGIKAAFSDSFSGDTKSFAYSIDSTDFTDLIEEVEAYMLETLARKKAILLVSFDEAATIFNQIDENSQLLDYCWYGTDGIANISAMLEDGPGQKAAETGLQCSTYSPYIVEMFSPRLLLFNHWMNGSMHQPAAPEAVLSYDSTWLAFLAYMLNSSESTPTPAKIWSKLTEEANLLTGFSYAETLDANGDRLNKYYSFYQLEENDGILSWNVANSFMESEDKTKSLKRIGTIANKSGSDLLIRYKRDNLYSNGVPVAEKKCDNVKSGKLPLGDFIIPANLILDNGVMTGTLSVFIDGNYFPCDVIIGDWQKSDDLSSYIFTTSKEKMKNDYYPMTLEIDHSAARWAFNCSNILLDKLDWSDGIEVRIDVNRKPVVTLNYKPELNLKISFNKENNGIDYTSQSLESITTQMDVSRMMTCYSSKNPWKSKFLISKSTLSTTDSFNPQLFGVTLKANDKIWTVPAGGDWGKHTEEGIYKHKNATSSSKTQWLFDKTQEIWQFNAKGVNTIAIANTLVEQKGILLELSSGENNKNLILLKPKINATLHRRK